MMLISVHPQVYHSNVMPFCLWSNQVISSKVYPKLCILGQTSLSCNAPLPNLSRISHCSQLVYLLWQLPQIFFDFGHLSESLEHIFGCFQPSDSIMHLHVAEIAMSYQLLQETQGTYLGSN